MAIKIENVIILKILRTVDLVDGRTKIVYFSHKTLKPIHRV